ncbi:CvpA family protein [Oceanobacillus sp. FSL H7-0719]|uniref:CvpA family protein n=1 Tax=Oceanobacillus sp. FSL H7-0719 TaxID=2954507 RepID=UPI003244D827
MLDIILIVLLLFGLFIGLARGFILQLLHLVGFITAFVVAAIYYDDLAGMLELWLPYQEIKNNAWADFLNALPLEMAFYSIVSFAIIFFAVKIILQIIANMLDFVASIPLINIVNKLSGAVLGLVEVYLIAFIILFVLALTPVEGIQTALNNSFIAMLMLEKTPYFSGKVFDLIQTYVSNL